ncbi:Elongator subunit Iki1-domain-containing protein [Powellomyces hirtus]|nr:Elongator subunit Iki1-domain-containing protein [Powellomyces hirtus]
MLCGEPTSSRTAIVRELDVFSSWSYTPSRPDPAVPSATTSTLIEGLERIIPPATDAKTTVLFDSITPFLLHHPIGVFARLLKRLAALGDHVSLILPFHGDVAPSEHTETSVDAILAHVATTYMTVRHGKDFGVMLDGTGDRDVFNAVDANSTVGAVVEFMHKKKSGKIVRELVAYKIPSDDKAPWIVSTLDELRGLDALRVEETKQPDEEPDPAANLSFNLRLTDAQKNARAEVVLPYMHVQTASDTTQQPSTASIYYDDDDYDEEDPDADLDI